MKFAQSLVATLFCFFSLQATAIEHLIELRGAQGLKALHDTASAKGLTVRESFKAFGRHFAVLQSEDALASQAHSLAKASFVLQMEENYRYRLAMGGSAPKGPGEDDIKDLDPRPLVTNDSSFNRLWAVLNYGQSLQETGLRGMDSAIAQAWSQASNLRPVIVGVMDTGLDAGHPDLAGRTRPGFNAIGKGGTEDDHAFFHGTHVAGTIAAVQNNGRGIAGVAPNAMIVPIKIFAANSSTDSAAILRGLSWIYERRDEIRIVNHSWEGADNSTIMREAFERLDDAGIVNVFAAGNSNMSLDEYDNFPAKFVLRHSIVVAAHDSRGQRASFSNFSPNWVDLAAPGVDIFSLQARGKYRSLYGTSMAAPHVAGAVALLWGLRPQLSPLEVRNRVSQSGTPTQSLQRTSRGGRRLNVLEAILED
jgi:subtilisin family serine protease